jgi:hypothetical protein
MALCMKDDVTRPCVALVYEESVCVFSYYRVDTIHYKGCALWTLSNKLYQISW